MPNNIGKAPKVSIQGRQMYTNKIHKRRNYEKQTLERKENIKARKKAKREEGKKENL